MVKLNRILLHFISIIVLIVIAGTLYYISNVIYLQFNYISSVEIHRYNSSFLYSLLIYGFFCIPPYIFYLVIIYLFKIKMNALKTFLATTFYCSFSLLMGAIYINTFFNFLLIRHLLILIFIGIITIPVEQYFNKKIIRG